MLAFEPPSAPNPPTSEKTLLLLRVLCVLCGLILPSSPVAQENGGMDTVRIGFLKDGVYDTVTLPMETYVARVLAGEALPGSEPAALEALAIAIRTYTIANRGKHRADGFDLCDQTHCQVVRTATAATERAALATAGRILLYRGAPAAVYYSASCGGRTEKPSNVWPGAEDPPYLPSRDDDGCGGSPQWTAELTIADLQRALNGGGFRGTLRGVHIASRNASGRVQTLSLDGLAPPQISGQDLRAAVGRTLGWQRILSTAFDLRRAGNAYRFSGHGSGHGVGMCVIGSTKLALRGESAAGILGRYFPGAGIGTVGPRLTSVPAGRTSPLPADVAVALPEGDEGERAVIAALVLQERNALAKTLEVPEPRGVTLRFHPTTEAYERATRQPWFTLGTRVGDELHFVGLATLRDRGVLERTIRRQLVHLMTDDALGERPAWVREGAALYYADGDAPRAAARSAPRACPRDNELLQPTSAGSLMDALTGAVACFAREASSGRRWRDVR